MSASYYLTAMVDNYCVPQRQLGLLPSAISDKMVFVQLALDDGSACLVASSLRGQSLFSSC